MNTSKYEYFHIMELRRLIKLLMESGAKNNLANIFAELATQKNCKGRSSTIMKELLFLQRAKGRLF
jgi:hypothetical protein